MVIRESDTELDISGTPAELNAIADRIERLGPGEELSARADDAATRGRTTGASPG